MPVADIRRDEEILQNGLKSAFAANPMNDRSWQVIAIRFVWETVSERNSRKGLWPSQSAHWSLGAVVCSMGDRKAKLRESFDLSAGVYDRMRPGYPQRFVADVIALSRIPADGRILEIGCDTGQATAPFADRGYSIDCLDIGEELAAVARAKFSNRNRIRVIVSSFEDWKPPDRRYDLIIAATSFHWVDPAVAYVKSASLLKSTGGLAVFANVPVNKSEGFFARAQDVYRTAASSTTVVTANEREGPCEPGGLDLFDDPVVRRYPFSIEYDANDYIALLSTYSDHISLPDSERGALFSGLAKLIETEYAGKILKRYEAVLELRRLRSE